MEVPIPTFPLASIMKGVESGEVASSTTKLGPVPVLVTESLPHGEVVPIPTFLLESTISPVPPTVRSDEKRFVELAVVEKKFVVVAFVPVAFTKVKF